MRTCAECGQGGVRGAVCGACRKAVARHQALVAPAAAKLRGLVADAHAAGRMPADLRGVSSAAVDWAMTVGLRAT